MEFGTLIFPKPRNAISDVPFAEQRGFDVAWMPDSHMIWGDTYACLALAAVNTKKIKLATGVAIATNRIPPVTVHSIATINEIAPGRVMLGFGTGHTGRRVMGLPPVKMADFREQVRLIASLLRSGEAEYATEGLRRKIRYLHRDLRFINLDDRIPFYIAGNGSKIIEMAAEFGDGLVTTGVSAPERLAKVQGHLKIGAERAGRKLQNFPIVSLTHVCVLQPGEKLDSPRVVKETGHWVMASFHAMAAGYASPASLPAEARPVYEAYAEHVAKMAPAEERYLRLHEGHCTFVTPQERRFVTPESIRATTMVGPREELLERLRVLQQAGLTQVFLNPPMDGFQESIDSFSREVIERI